MILRRTICFARAAGVNGCSSGLYSIDAICVSSVWCGNTTPPMAMPTKNIAASITAITPSFRGAVSLPICLSKSSRSYRSIFTSPFFVNAKRKKPAAVPLIVEEQIVSSVISGRNVNHQSAGLRRADVCQSPGAVLWLRSSHNLRSIGATHNDRFGSPLPAALAHEPRRLASWRRD